eukprot:TRINITY_DN4450_c0_g1_i1.p2 TRINITY_DN4450_c0_g1~~TRINITY_DN4450_c0_g1_i1.p2  ORF type:complete len:134 (+),score=8.30 TRINITY_DN4450_c0_g1_i1:152-553(+)
MPNARAADNLLGLRALQIRGNPVSIQRWTPITSDDALELEQCFLWVRLPGLHTHFFDFLQQRGNLMGGCPNLLCEDVVKISGEVEGKIVSRDNRRFSIWTSISNASSVEAGTIRNSGARGQRIWKGRRCKSCQ